VDDLLKLSTPAAGRFEGVGAMAGVLVLRVASGYRSVARVTKDEAMLRPREERTEGTEDAPRDTRLM
jgi:hypothetical protein